jgi:Poly(ADP-ribose) polymerase and DNA-Ligase Zn-finger region
MADEEPSYMKEIEAIRQGQGETADALPKPTVAITYAPTDRAKCKESSCKQQILKGTLRILKTSMNENIGHNMAVSYHAECFFCKTMINARAWRYQLSESGNIEPPLEQFDDLADLDKEMVKNLVAKGNALKEEKASKPKSKKRTAKEDDEDAEDDQPHTEGSAAVKVEGEPSLATSKPKRTPRPTSKKSYLVSEEELNQYLNEEGVEEDDEDLKPKRKLKKNSKKAVDDDDDEF